MNDNLYLMNKDCCPDRDTIIVNGLCSGCRHYKGFDLYYGQPCIKCSFYAHLNNDDDVKQTEQEK